MYAVKRSENNKAECSNSAIFVVTILFHAIKLSWPSIGTVQCVPHDEKLFRLSSSNL